MLSVTKHCRRLLLFVSYFLQVLHLCDAINTNMLAFCVQNMAKGVDVYDEMLHYPWLLRLTKSESL